MKFPNHILLDMNRSLTTTKQTYWAWSYATYNTTFPNLQKTIWPFSRSKIHVFFTFQKTKTIRHSFLNKTFFTFKNKLQKIKFLQIPRIKIKNRLLYKNMLPYSYYRLLKKQELKNSHYAFLRQKLKTLNSNFVASQTVTKHFDIFFLKKEKIYTKLKYSRTPQYDIVSGGFAAILSGFLGFLICEKFGFELLDSGDFYFLFMYLVFLIFTGRLFLKITSKNISAWHFLSFKWFFNFYKILCILLWNRFFK